MSHSPNPSGTRKRDGVYLDTLRRANEWNGLPPGTDRFSIIRALKTNGVARRLNWTPHQVMLTERLISTTHPSDWKAGSRPEIWLPQKDLKELFGCESDSTVRYHVRRLMKLGVLAMRDSSNCHRKVHYDPKTGERVAFGIDLSPIASILPNVMEKARNADDERYTCNLHRERIKSLRQNNSETLDQALHDARLSPEDPDSVRLRSRIEALWPRKCLTRLSHSALESLLDDAKATEADLIATLAPSLQSPSTQPEDSRISQILAGKPTKSCCPTSENQVQPITITNESEIELLVAADFQPIPSAEMPTLAAAPPGPERENGSSGEASYRPEDIKGPAGEQVLEALSPRIAQYLPPGREPSMEDFVEAASRTRRDLKISRALWDKACRRMSPGGASLALAHVAAKWDAGKIRQTPGAYFTGVFESALKGELNLAASLWGMVKSRTEVPELGLSSSSAGQPAVSAGAPADRPEWRGLPILEVDTAAEHQSMPLFPDDLESPPARIVANPKTMHRFCTTVSDSAAMREAWLELVRTHGQWPYLDEVRSHYAEIRRRAASREYPGPHISRFGSDDWKTDMTNPDAPPPAMSPAALRELLPRQSPGRQHMPPSIREAHALLKRIQAMTDAERSSLTPADNGQWLAALAVTRMPPPLARFMPPLGTLDCDTVIAATKRALPELRISPRAWKAFCRQQHEFSGVIAVCIVVGEIHDHPGPVPEDLPDKILKQLSTHEGMSAFFKSRELKSERP